MKRPILAAFGIALAVSVALAAAALAIYPAQQVPWVLAIIVFAFPVLWFLVWMITNAAGVAIVPSPLDCCARSKWVAERDVGSASGFDMSLGRCGSCGTPWMGVYCTASSVGGFERVTTGDAEKIRAIEDPQELRAFMKGWVERTI
jgi:hypothetical protein